MPWSPVITRDLSREDLWIKSNWRVGHLRTHRIFALVDLGISDIVRNTQRVDVQNAGIVLAQREHIARRVGKCHRGLVRKVHVVEL